MNIINILVEGGIDSIGVDILLLVLWFWLANKMSYRFLQRSLFKKENRRAVWLPVVVGMIVLHVIYNIALFSFLVFKKHVISLFYGDDYLLLSLIYVLFYAAVLAVEFIFISALCSYALGREKVLFYDLITGPFAKAGNWLFTKVGIPGVLLFFLFGCIYGFFKAKTLSEALDILIVLGISALGCYIYFKTGFLDQNKDADPVHKHKWTRRYARVGLRDIDLKHAALQEKKEYEQFLQEMSYDRHQKPLNSEEQLNEVTQTTQNKERSEVNVINRARAESSTHGFNNRVE